MKTIAMSCTYSITNVTLLGILISQGHCDIACI